METIMPRASIPPMTPARHKMAVLTFLALLVPVYLIPDALFYVFPGQKLLVTVLAVALIVALMMYLIMPALTSIFRRWLISEAKP
jgi:antibiotic biosynthesis monooxygenase (ABM) superfamily enzyme